jgi:hypothetical protein
MKRALLSAAALLALSVTASGQFVPPPPNQNLAPPFDYPPILSTTPQQVLAIDTARRRIIFFNPSQTATIAFCPSGVTRAETSNVASITPGYVIRLPASRAEGAPMVEGKVSP